MREGPYAHGGFPAQFEFVVVCREILFVGNGGDAELHHTFPSMGQDGILDTIDTYLNLGDVLGNWQAGGMGVNFEFGPERGDAALLEPGAFDLGFVFL